MSDNDYSDSEESDQSIVNPSNHKTTHDSQKDVPLYLRIAQLQSSNETNSSDNKRKITKNKSSYDRSENYDRSEEDDDCTHEKHKKSKHAPEVLKSNRPVPR